MNTSAFVYTNDVNILGGTIHTTKENKTLVVDSKEMGLEVHADKTKCMAMSQDQNAGQNRNIKADNKSFESVEQFKYSETTLRN